MQQEEKKFEQQMGLPGAKQEYDHWDTLLREFVQGTALDLRQQNLKEISPKLFQCTQLTSIDISDNPGLTFIPENFDMLVNLKTIRLCNNNIS